MRHYLFLLLLLCGFVSATPARAGDDGLYPAAAPAGSAFVRFLNGSSTSSVPVRMQGKSYGAATLGKVTAYAPVQKGETSINLGSRAATVALEEGKHYTALLTKMGLTLLPEPDAANKLKAHVILINASSISGVALKTTDGAVSIVDAVAPARLEGRAVNAVKVPLAVYKDKSKLEDLGTHPLERGARYAVVVYDGPNGKPAVSFN